MGRGQVFVQLDILKVPTLPRCVVHRLEGGDDQVLLERCWAGGTGDS